MGSPNSLFETLTVAIDAQEANRQFISYGTNEDENKNRNKVNGYHKRNDCEVRKNERRNKSNAPDKQWIPGFCFCQLSAICVRLGNSETL